METEWLVTIVGTGATVVGYTWKRVVDYWLGRGKIRFDEATILRQELEKAIRRKDEQVQRNDDQIQALTRRVDDLEAELEKAERERDDQIIKLERYKLDVYRTLIDHGADKKLVDSVLAIQER